MKLKIIHCLMKLEVVLLNKMEILICKTGQTRVIGNDLQKYMHL